MHHRSALLSFTLAFSVGFGVALVACASPTADTGGNPPGTPGSVDAGATDDGGARSGACPLCVTDDDCNGGICAQFGGDSYCAPACGKGDSCASGRVCTAASTVTGEQASVCIPKDDSCGTPVGPGTGTHDAGHGTPGCTPPASTDTCGALNGPSVASPCTCASGHTCAANNCYGGWWCNTTTKKCQAPPAPSTCPPPPGCSNDAGSVTIDAGGPVTGTIGPDGGTATRLFFAVVGDTRPPVINDTSAYPTQVITQIWDDLEALSPKPTFALSTGDYLFSSANGTQAAPQIDMYLQARAHYTGMTFPAMGNHECTGAVTSNCGPNNVDGITANYQAFLSKMLAPINKQTPNYAVNVNASDGSWTSKFVFIAGNAWDSSSDPQWLDGVLSQPTTYTFVIRHEPVKAGSPGEQGSQPIIDSHPYTLAIVGHTHTYAKSGLKQVTIGNGGAPLVGGANYGYGLFQQRSDGSVQVDMIDYQSGQPDLAFRFAVNPDGTPAP